MKFFLKRFNIGHSLLSKGHTDERVSRGVNAEYARVYFLFIALIIIVTALQLAFVTRFIVAYIPAIVGGGGSLLYFFYKYHREGLFTVCISDERIEESRTLIKAMSYQFCLIAIIFLSFPLIFLDLPHLMLGGILLTWAIPTSIAVTRITLRGLDIPGSKSEWTEQKRKLRRGVIWASILYALMMNIPRIIQGNYESTLHAILTLSVDFIIHSVFFGVLFYFGMISISKISNRRANKQLKALGEESDCDTE